MSCPICGKQSLSSSNLYCRKHNKEELVKKYLDTIANRLSADYDVSLDKAYELVEDLNLLYVYANDYDYLLHEDISTWVDLAYERYKAGVKTFINPNNKIKFLTPNAKQIMENAIPKEVEPNNRLEEGKKALKEFKPMTKCDCYFEQEVVDPYLYDRRLVGRCNGTKERDVCQCCGNPAMCDFYSEKRKEACRQTQEYRDTKELEFYRTWIKEHNLEELAEKAFKEYLDGKEM